MKKFVLGALAVTAALAAGPAMAGGTHISVGLFSPAPVVAYQPAPVVYYPPVQHVYYAPPRPYPYRVAYYDHPGRGHGHRHDPHHYARWGSPRDYGWR